MSLVSILIPCHNAASWLRVCVVSALAQTHPDIEVIVFDDGSTDESLSTLADLHDTRLRLMSGPGQGGNIARNRMLAAATGEWVQFLDADDYLQPDKISRQLSEAAGHTSADVLYSPVHVETWSNGQPVCLETSTLDAGSDLFTQWLTWQLPQTGGALWRRDSLLRIGIWKEDQPCCQEHELYQRALKNGLCFRFCPTPGAVYRIWSNQTVCRRDPLLVIREKTKLIDDMIDWLNETGQLRRVHRRAAGQACFEMARTWAAHDIVGASRYANERTSQSLFVPSGPAAPRSYLLFIKLFGFKFAERLARALRPRHLR